MALPSSFTTPVASGIQPSGGIGAQLQALTRRAVVPVVFTQIYQSHPLLSLLFSNSQRAKGGVNGVTIPVQGAPFTQFSWGGFGGDFAIPTDQEAITNLQFTLKLGMVPIGFFGMEALIQSSEVIVPKLRVVMSDAIPRLLILLFKHTITVLIHHHTVVFPVLAILGFKVSTIVTLVLVQQLAPVWQRFLPRSQLVLVVKQ
jgi:hypothetical protein